MLFVRNRLIVRGAREHNLANVSLDLPRDALIVFTGLSGSGKSSLAFDTIFAEGQRRYVESLSSYARMFIGQMDKPDVDFIEGLSPAVSIDQKSTSRNPRSTVGTITEVYDYLRLLFARIGQAHCPVCGQPITRQSVQQITDRLLALPVGTRFQVLAPVVSGRKGEYKDLFAELAGQGYARVRVDGQACSLSAPPALDKQKKHSIDVIVDRLQAKPETKQRVTDSVETALGLAGGTVAVEFVDEPAGSPGRERRYSQNWACPEGHDVQLDELEPRQFSFNAPWGACPACTGLGVSLEVDLDLILPDTSLSLAERAVAVWTTPTTWGYYRTLLQTLADTEGFSLNTPWRELGAKAKRLILYGKGDAIQVRYRNRFGRARSFVANWEGVIPHIKRRHDEADSDTMRERYAGFMREVPCSTCQGARLKPSSLAVTVGSLNIAEVAALSIAEALAWVDELVLTDRQTTIAQRVLKEIKQRLRFLCDVGLTYLTLARSAASLSGGEAQRIRLATQIGSSLMGVLYVLDEPSIGLHQRDNHRLIETLVRLRDLGNTLIVVEHDEDTIRAADWVVDIGPGAGEHGGHVVVSGPVAELLAAPDSLTGAYLAGRRSIPLPERRRAASGRAVTVVGASENNLRGIDVRFPLGLFIAVTGVSGSGKSSLVNSILYTALAKRIYGAKAVPGHHRKIAGADLVDKVIHVDQSPIGRTPRSNPATYTGVFDRVRSLFAETPEAKVRGYLPGRFSVNVKGGRCENCAGDGTIKIEMNFLPDVYVPCEVCHGARYNRETLEVRYKGKTIADILDLPIEQAAEFFAPFQAISRHLTTLVDVGLGYVRLGQPATTLSGGEAQRVKLAAELQKRSTGRTLYVLDEPTTGLHFEDIRKLLAVLGRLVDQGNTVVVIEHNLDVVKTADWVIDLGPEGGSGGGLVIAEGTPEQVAQTPGSHTGRFLAPVLAGHAVAQGAEPLPLSEEADLSGVFELPDAALAAKTAKTEPETVTLAPKAVKAKATPKAAKAKTEPKAAKPTSKAAARAAADAAAAKSSRAPAV
ncbi:MAG: excinuclease ABC subunit UvrA [Propionibacteriaceae bacterium]|jgi:excinuclease ABC subunit A|nr:excinuclease ABC subunit UvrA [Propionibacteriaceae bacterium]